MPRASPNPSVRVRPPGHRDPNERPPAAGTSLAARFPAIARQWHPTKNGRLTPDAVHWSSERRVYWQCPAHGAHTWQTQVQSRTGHGGVHGCPLCSGNGATAATSLRARRPDIAAQWHPSKNGDLTPDDVLPGSTRKVWWRCAVDPRHVWEAKVEGVTRSPRGGCPYCQGKRVTLETSLLGCFPEIAAEWHPTLNGALGPGDVTWSSQRRVSWLCGSCQHVWQTVVAGRGRTGSGCPACASRVATPKNSLRALFPDLVREWHPTKNGALTPDDVVPGTARRVAWQCAKNPSHAWTTPLSVRTVQGCGCPFCARKRVSPETALAVSHPRLAREWHPKRNAPLTPKDILAGANRKAWWRCHRDPTHVWEADVSSRAWKGAGCPFCARKVATPKTSLAARNPRVARAWHPTRNAPLTPKEVLPRSGRRVWWRCTKDPSHAWQACIYNVVASTGNGCPICLGRVATPATSLRARLPELAADWHPTKNRPLSPDAVVPGSNKRVWWRCRVDPRHVWATTVRNRARKGHGCPHCSGWARHHPKQT